MAQRKREEATVSFHFFVRERRKKGLAPEIVPFTSTEFKQFADRLVAQPDIDIKDRNTCEAIKNSTSSPVEKCEIIDDRTVFGLFRALYSGHAYDNTDVGEIPESSVSLRPFFFIAYLSESGRIYVGSQYLGQFGGYTGLKKTLARLIGSTENLISHSFRHDASAYTDAKPKAIRVNYARKASEITSQNTFGQRGAMTFRQLSSKDEEFRATVSTKILAKLGQSDAVLKKAVAEMLSGNEILSLRDEDVEDCSVVATINGKDRTINVIEAGHFATRFPLEINEYIKGHPDRTKTKEAMLKLLKHQIIARSERV